MKAKRIWMISIAIITWFALALQFYLMLNNVFAPKLGAVTTIINFFSYFTILSNLFIAICLSLLLLNSPGFFSKITVQSGIALYIFIVALVYNLVLRSQWKPTGWQLVADNLLHVGVPLFYLIYWTMFTPSKSLQWKNIFPWLIFPVIYFSYSLIRGEMTGWYPYPFINADHLGYAKVMINSLLVLLAFIVFGLIIVAINRSVRRSAATR